MITEEHNTYFDCIDRCSDAAVMSVASSTFPNCWKNSSKSCCVASWLTPPPHLLLFSCNFNIVFLPTLHSFCSAFY